MNIGCGNDYNNFYSQVHQHCKEAVGIRETEWKCSNSVEKCTAVIAFAFNGVCHVTEWSQVLCWWFLKYSMKFYLKIVPSVSLRKN
jgi:hypothetical protein